MGIERCYGCMEPWSGMGPCPHCGYESGKQNNSLNVLPEGTVLAGKYLIGRTLGAGGFGITYIGWDLNLDLKIAIKEYYPNNFVSRQAEYSHCVSVFNRTYVSQYNAGLDGFLTEAKTLARFVRQPGIVFVRDYFQENGTAYIVMEFAEGQTLRELLAQMPGECLPADRVFDMMLPVMEALAKVHKAGMIHRDISPDNLMVDPEGKVTLLDFGSARDYTDEKSLSVILKPGYAPEEQYRKRGKQGPWTDIYSLCATMYRAITGQVPMDALDRREKDELKSPSELGVKIRPEQEKALMKGLSVRAQDRFQSMEELIRELAKIRPTPDPGPKWKFVIGGTAAAAVLVIGILCAAVFSEKRGTVVPETETDTAAMAEDDVNAAGETDESGKTGDTDDGSDGTEIASMTGIELSALSLEDIFADAVTYSGDSQEEFYELLASDDVSAVILDSHLGLTTGALAISKPLQITANGGFDGYVPITVSSGGYVRIEEDGQFCSWDGLLQVTDGGCISVADGGLLADNALIWLEQEENLLLEDGADLSLNGNSYDTREEALESVPDMLFLLDIDELFADAVHVTTQEDYQEAREKGASAIVIDADLTLGEEYSVIDIPLMISEGVTLSGGSETSADGDDPWTIFLQGSAVLVNYGTLSGRLNTDDSNGGYVTALNYGTMDCEIIDMQASGWLLNYGSMQIGCHEVRNTLIYNLGTIRMTGTEQAGENWVDLYTAFYNYGTLQVEPETMDSMYLSLHGNASLLNSGTLTIGENSWLTSDAIIRNRGTITLESQTSGLSNSGLIYCNESSSILALAEGSACDNTGIIFYSEASATDIPDSGSSGFLWFGWNVLDLESVCDVYSEEELNSALADENCKCIVMQDSTIEVSGDLTVTDKLLVIDGEDTSLIVKDGDLIVSGESGGLYGAGGTINLYGGTLVLDTGAAAIFETSDLLENCVGITVRENAGIVINSYEADLSGMTIALSDGAHFTSLHDLGLYSCSLLLLDSQFFCNDSLAIYNCSVNIQSGGTLDVENYDNGGGLFIDAKSAVMIEEGGVMELGESVVTIAGSVENAGELHIRYAPSTDISGSLVNTGTVRFCNEIGLTGTLENSGTVYAVADGDNPIITVQEDGSFTGNEPETLDTWPW
ncbi:MAG: protein kinase [Clostridiales bacterium]|nr:protein kinase [Clostridiales bacterium]